MHQLAPSPYTLEEAEAEQRQRMTIGRNIHGARVEAELTQEQLAEQLSDRLGRTVAQAHVSRWERGRLRPRPRTLEVLSELFGHGDDTAWLYGTASAAAASVVSPDAQASAA